ncbi:hypothetical protein EAW52_02160 [Pseudomonas sp. LTJR-52]|nr:hypothetical protein EAW52_02160 [Pseudomonas sp. LTJR-52]RRW47463.1 hypothetical protein EGJ50_10565 [Pseudomonas luteola]
MEAPGLRIIPGQGIMWASGKPSMGYPLPSVPTQGYDRTPKSQGVRAGNTAGGKVSARIIQKRAEEIKSNCLKGSIETVLLVATGKR